MVEVGTDRADEVAATEAKVGAFMSGKFPDYVPLQHHLMDYEVENILRQYSKTTAESELSVFNLYTGGEGQTEERMGKIEGRKVCEVAAPDIEEESEEEG